MAESFNFPAQGFFIHNRVGFAQRFGWRGIASAAKVAWREVAEQRLKPDA